MCVICLIISAKYFYMDVVVLVGLSCVIAVIVVCWGHSILLKIAKEKNIVDNPDARKLQKRPVPVMGGIAVFFGVVAGLAFGICFISEMQVLFPILLSMIIMFYMGFMDDTVGLTPSIRFVAEILTIICLITASDMCVDNLHGIWRLGIISHWIAIPLTIFAGVGIINAVNMIDGVNGLSSGLCIVYSVLFGIVFFKSGDIPNAMLAFTMAASLFPFLIHNIFGNTSKMYIGDTGTMLMGIVLCWFIIVSLHSDSMLVKCGFNSNFSPVAFCLAVLSVPVFDTLRVMTLRIVRGKSPFKPDRTHLHHVLIDLGISPSITSLSEIMLDIFVVLVWVIAYVFNASVTMQLYVVVIAALLSVVGLYFFLNNQMKHDTRLLHKIQKFSIRTHLGHTQWWLRFQRYLDKNSDILH